MRTTSKWNWKWSFAIAAIGVALAAAGGRAISAPAQDKYSLRLLPNGLPFSDWKGYESWQFVSVAQTDERLKAMLANPTMIDARRTASAFRAAAAGDTRSSTTTPRPTRSRPTRKALPIAGTDATRRSPRRTTSFTRTRSAERTTAAATPRSAAASRPATSRRSGGRRRGTGRSAPSP